MKILKKTVIIILSGTAALVVLAALSIAAVRFALQREMSQKLSLAVPPGIDSLEKIRLGGSDQWILVRGKDAAKPVLLYLHGGPGSPLFLSAHQLGVTAKLEEHFVVVYWEQLGTGKSYNKNIPASAMTVDRFAADTAELSRLLAKRFGREKIFLLGRSWGSIIGLLAVRDHPGLYHAYIGIGQVVNSLMNDTISYQYTLREATKEKHERAIRDLKAVGYPPYKYKDMLKQRKWLRAFGGSTFGHRKEDGMVNPEIIQKALGAPHYSITEVMNMLLDPFFSVRHLWHQLYSIDFFTQVPEIRVPVWFFAGRHDYMVPWELTEKYYTKLRAPRGKHLVWFDRSGHGPEYEEPEKFNEAMIEVLAESR